MKRSAIFALSFLACLTLMGLAQQPTISGTAAKSKPVYYDTFKGPWIDQTKWLPYGPRCSYGLTLECVREVQQGRLRLVNRSTGSADTNGEQESWTELDFVDPTSINSIAADVTLSWANVVGCPTNPNWQAKVSVTFLGAFFNTGVIGDSADDVLDQVLLMVTADNPKMMSVNNWMSTRDFGLATYMGSFPIGTPLTLSNSWDKAGQRFVSTVQIVGEPETLIKVTVPYSFSDSAPPVGPKNFDVFSFSPNCVASQTFAGGEAFIDNVQINVPPPSTK